MNDFLTPGSVASEIRLLRTDYNDQSIFIFVEGETDINFFSKYMDNNECKFRSLRGREKVLELLRIMVSDGDQLCIAIVDADFWHIEGKTPETSNLFMTDTHDVEMMIFKTDVINKIMHEYIPVETINHLRRQHPKIQEFILNAVTQMAVIRWLNYRHNLGICFHVEKGSKEPLEWGIAIDINSMIVDFEKLLDIVCNGKCELKTKILLFKEFTKYEDYDPYNFCNGHDVVYVTLLLLQKFGKAQFVSQLKAIDLERHLRIAYEANLFKETDLYKSIFNWQQTTGKPVLN